MIIHVLGDTEALGVLAARHVEVALLAASRPTLGVATGSSPEPVYRALSERARRGTFRADRLHAFALDEYIGLPPDHEESYRRVLERVFAEPTGVSPSRLHVPDGASSEPADAAAQFERDITLAGGIDLQILGIGQNGHIGFNEPGSDFRSATRVVELTESTRTANARFFDDDDHVPRRSISQGLGTIMRSRAAMLIASGEAKASPLVSALCGPVTTEMPASILQRHPALTVYADAAAAEELDLQRMASIGVVHDWR